MASLKGDITFLSLSLGIASGGLTLHAASSLQIFLFEYQKKYFDHFLPRDLCARGHHEAEHRGRAASGDAGQVGSQGAVISLELQKKRIICCKEKRQTDAVWLEQMTYLNVDIRPKVEEELHTADPPRLGRHHQGGGPVLRTEVDMTHDPGGGKISTYFHYCLFSQLTMHIYEL